MYFDRKSRYRFMPGSSLHCGSVASFRNAAEITPLEFWRPAGAKVAPIDEETTGRKWRGCQSISATFLMLWAANFGVAMLNSTSAPEALSFTIWLSMVGSV